MREKKAMLSIVNFLVSQHGACVMGFLDIGHASLALLSFGVDADADLHDTHTTVTRQTMGTSSIVLVRAEEEGKGCGGCVLLEGIVERCCGVCVSVVAWNISALLGDVKQKQPPNLPTSRPRYSVWCNQCGTRWIFFRWVRW